MTTPVIDPVRFAQAVEYAAEAHASQFRKRAPGDDRPRMPYLSHLLAVAGLVIEDNGDTDEAIAGLPHEVIEDQNDGGQRPIEIETSFGRRVRTIVEGCSEADGPQTWDRFNAGADDQLWWYTSLGEAFAVHAEAGRSDAARVDELRRLVQRMREESLGIKPKFWSYGDWTLFE